MFLFLKFGCYFGVKRVYCYEVVVELVFVARQNAKLNGLHYATFIQGDLNNVSESFVNDFLKPYIVVSTFILT